ncbi:MAG TPA: hypothetical protein VMR25_12820 [Planctomycetaceae bacterium]|jgi:hypothetical protein|nr:hypothetical protein [Planctomycetaceae bacterium]
MPASSKHDLNTMVKGLRQGWPIPPAKVEEAIREAYRTLRNPSTASARHCRAALFVIIEATRAGFGIDPVIKALTDKGPAGQHPNDQAGVEADD